MTEIAACAVFVIATLLFGGAFGQWFAPGFLGNGLAAKTLQMMLGSSLMGAGVALLGNVCISRHAIRWGVVLPLLVAFSGPLFAMLAGYNGASTFLIGSPLLCGFSVAGGLLTSFLAGGFSAPRRA